MGGIIFISLLVVVFVALLVTQEKAKEYVTYVRRDSDDSSKEQFLLVGEGVMKISNKSTVPSVTIRTESGELITYRSKSFYNEYISLRELRRQNEVEVLPLV